LAASVAIFSKMSLMNEFLRQPGRSARQPQRAGGPARRASVARRARPKTHMMDMALEEMPVSGCTCFSTL
jgi:hypothetical protein